MPHQSETELLAWVAAMPKAELHLHLEGNVQPATVLELARRHHRLDHLPAQDEAGLRNWFQFRDFPHFIQVYLTLQDLMRTPDDFALLAYECGADMHAQNIRYREVTFTPYTHIHHQQKGLGITDILQGLEQGRQRARADFRVEMRWVFDISRNLSFPEEGSLRYDPEPAIRTLDYALQGRDQGVVALGLGGYEPVAPGRFFAEIFEAARAVGLARVPHAGETDGAASVRDAVERLHANRIGHGVRAVDDPGLLRDMAERQIPLEVCPTSNIRLKVYPDYAAHPLRRLDEAGVIVTLNSDDPPLFNADLLHEYRTALTHLGFQPADLLRIARNAFVVSLAEPALQQTLLAEFDAWASAAPPPSP